MSIRININSGGSIPLQNDAGLTLVIFMNARHRVVEGTAVTDVEEISSVEELSTYFGGATPDTPSVAEFNELYSAEYLLRRGVKLLCYAVETAGSFVEDDWNRISDQAELNYKFIVVPYNFITYNGVDTVTYPDVLVTGVTTQANNVDAQLYLDLDPFVEANTDGGSGGDNLEDIKALITELPSSKVELFVNSGFTGYYTDLTVPATISVGEATIATPGEFAGATDYVGIPSSLAVVVRKARLLETDTPWVPVAGEYYGTVPEFTSLHRRFFTQEKEDFQAQNINIIVNRRGVGNLFVSQNTMADTTVASNPLIRSHVVTEALWLKDKFEAIANSAYHLTNNQRTWDIVSLKLNKVLQNVLEAGGIEEFRVAIGKGITMTEQDIADGKMIVNIRYLPIRVIEEIEFNVVIADQALSSEVQITENGGEF